MKKSCSRKTIQHILLPFVCCGARAMEVEDLLTGYIFSSPSPPPEHAAYKLGAVWDPHERLETTHILDPVHPAVPKTNAVSILSQKKDSSALGQQMRECTQQHYEEQTDGSSGDDEQVPDEIVQTANYAFSQNPEDYKKMITRKITAALKQRVMFTTFVKTQCIDDNYKTFEHAATSPLAKPERKKTETMGEEVSEVLQRWIEELVFNIPTEQQFTAVVSAVKKEVDHVLSVSVQRCNRTKQWFDHLLDPHFIYIEKISEMIDERMALTDDEYDKRSAEDQKLYEFDDSGHQGSKPWRRISKHPSLRQPVFEQVRDDLKQRYAINQAKHIRQKAKQASKSSVFRSFSTAKKKVGEKKKKILGAMKRVKRDDGRKKAAGQKGDGLLDNDYLSMQR